MFRDRGLEIKTPDQIAVMRRAGLVVAETLSLLRSAVGPGVTTKQLDKLAEENIRTLGAQPNFLGYHGFPATICTSVNDEVVHGIPGDRVLEEGDVISIDCGAIVDGWHGDAAITVPVGEVSSDLVELIRVCEESLWRGLAAAALGGRVSDISHAIEKHVRGVRNPVSYTGWGERARAPATGAPGATSPSISRTIRCVASGMPSAAARSRSET